MTISELRQTIHQEIDRLPEKALDQVFQLIQQINPQNPAESPELDPLIGLFSGSSDLAEKSEEILAQEINNHSGWTWK
ncbi:MAG: hypothetical protein GC158_16865 [Cyanobacteria bacterium RI_101]|nr:hypothetical protein [Cyanobacteria bacterium RI_101]